MNLYYTQLPIHPYHHHPSPFLFFLLAFTHRLFLPSLLFYFYYFKSLVIRGSLLYSFLHPSSNYLHCIYYLHNINFNYYIIFAQKRPSLYYYILLPPPITSSSTIYYIYVTPFPRCATLMSIRLPHHLQYRPCNPLHQ
jgi:hypothetical protein